MVKLTQHQKEEIRRLTQRANRRIIGAYKEYAKYGREIPPAKVTGGIQTREQWETSSLPLSRSTQFATKAEYQERIRFLRTFDMGQASRPTMTEYTKIEREKIRVAMRHILGTDPGAKLEKQLGRMSAPELAEFWERFEENANRKGVQYSSDAVMAETLEEFFQEDLAHLLEG
mgnify:CR=1 FL=1